MFKKTVLIAAAVSVLSAGAASAESARDYISIVGSSTVYPFATVVAEQFGKTTNFKTPKIESTGSGGGLKLFCAGVGVQHPDITNASRAIKGKEIEKCAKNGIKEIVEIKIGYDGITVANSKSAPSVELSKRDIFLALAKDVPNPNGSETLVANPYKTWNQINKSLPNVAIEVLGPPPTSGTRDAFNELAIEGGCKTYPWLKAIKKQDKKKYKKICRSIREDGPYVEAGENDNLIVQKLVSNPDAFGVFGFSFLDQNRDKVQGAAINGVKPSMDTIADGSYPVSRPLFFYVKKAHVGVIPGMKAYLKEFTSEKAWGPEGYLSDRGLIAMPKKERKQFGKNARKLRPMDK
ncbi:MAG: PstS family phosphate ABC transporter substrate-binding protein [Leptospirillia bacterium]